VAASDPVRIAYIDEILRHMPHRFPFLLIDRMVDCEPGRYVKVVKNVSNSDWFIDRRLGKRDVMPQLLVLEALAQTSGVLCHYSGMTSTIGQSIIFFAGVDKLACERDVRVGDQLVLECTLNRSMRGVAKVSGRASVDGDTVLAGDLTAVIRQVAAS
jgi:3-hydroxyacyl-[acyl-carrier-protein] dehydratase